MRSTGRSKNNGTSSDQPQENAERKNTALEKQLTNYYELAGNMGASPGGVVPSRPMELRFILKHIPGRGVEEQSVD